MADPFRKDMIDLHCQLSGHNLRIVSNQCGYGLLTFSTIWGKNDIFVTLLERWKNIFQANRQERKVCVLKEKIDICPYYVFLCFLSLSDIKLEEKEKVDNQGTHSEECSKTGQDFDENRKIGTVRS